MANGVYSGVRRIEKMATPISECEYCTSVSVRECRHCADEFCARCWDIMKYHESDYCDHYDCRNAAYLAAVEQLRRIEQCE